MDAGISTGIYYEQELVEHLPAIQKAGFRRLEVCVGGRPGLRPHFDYNDASALDRLRQTLQTLGLSICSMHAPYSPGVDPSHPDAFVRKATLDEFCRAGRALKSLGGSTLVVHVSVQEFNLSDRAEKERRLRNVRDVLSPLVEELRSQGIRLALENLLPHYLGGDVAVLLDLVKPYPEEWAGVCFDTSHAHLWKTPSVYDMLDQALPRLAATHLSDNGGRFDDHSLPGTGTMDWGRILKKLKKFQGTMLLEVFRDDKGSSPEDVLVRAFRWAQEFLNG
ncbi:MAG TPA: sugar phosphate isomerase/epimerase family protein [Elusimicrobiota bacterium]|nr:sugar phosphate isomerase/epimerase family protein [Elusimicrobiota bacterium]